MERIAWVLSKTGRIALESVMEMYAATWIQITTGTTSRNISQVMEARYQVLNAPKETSLCLPMFEPIPAQARVPHLPKRAITGFRLKINNSSNNIVILTNWRNHVHNSRMSSWFTSLFWISWFSWSETKRNHPSFPRIIWRWQAEALCDTFLYPKSRQGKQCRREKQMANELSLLVWWLMWAELVYLLTYFQKRNFPYVSGSYMIYYVYIMYTVHTATYIQHQGIKCIPSNYHVFSCNDKSHSWPFPGPGS